MPEQLENYYWLLRDAGDAQVGLDRASSLEQLKPHAVRLASVVIRLLRRLEVEAKEKR